MDGTSHRRVACHTGRQPTIADPQINGQPVFKWVAECLYRRSGSSKYFALVKRHGKQYRKSLRTVDRQLAERRLSVFCLKIGRNGNSSRDPGSTFLELSRDWFAVAVTRLKPSSARGVEGSLRQLNKHFGLLAVRNITTAHCHDWEKMRTL